MRYLFAFLLLLTGPLAQAQCCPYVQPVQILPPNPTAADNIRLVFKAATGNAGRRVSTSFARVSNKLTFTGCYFSGMLTMPLAYTDTVRVGSLPPGTYTIVFVARQSSDPQQCIEEQRNSISSTMQISGAAPESGLRRADAGALYPVPASGRQLMFLPAAGSCPTAFALFDAAGRCCFSQNLAAPLPGDAPVPLNLPTLPAGSYTLRVARLGQSMAAYRVVME